MTETFAHFSTYNLFLSEILYTIEHCSDDFSLNYPQKTRHIKVFQSDQFQAKFRSFTCI